MYKFEMCVVKIYSKWTHLCIDLGNTQIPILKNDSKVLQHLGNIFK